MKRIFLVMTVLCLWALGATAAGVKAGGQKTLVDSCGFFPQLSPDGQWLLYSPTEATSLQLKNLSTGAVTTVASVGYPGFDAIFGVDGKVYYITQERKKNGLVYRTAHCYDPATGKSQVVLKAQHGRVQAINAANVWSSTASDRSITATARWAPMPTPVATFSTWWMREA